MMKKTLIVCATLCAALVITSCKSKESAYRKAYEKARAQEQVIQEREPQTVVAPVQERPVTQTTTTDNVDNEPVRQMDVTLVSGSGLKAYSVVVGAFSIEANARGLQQTLSGRGYNAQIVKNTDRNLYRVVAFTSDSKSEAVNSRNSLRSQYPDAWLLFQK